MKGRKLIEEKIIEAWEKTINIDYCNQRINSERSLQASFWSHLNIILSKDSDLIKNRRLFIEPSIKINTKECKKKIFPDIIVCNTKQVIAVIELKYLPRTKPRYKKDIKKLSLISENRKNISISNVRFRGAEKDAKQYTFSNNILFVWAGIHGKDIQIRNTLFSKGLKSLENCYIQLHAETELKLTPRVYIRQ